MDSILIKKFQFCVKFQPMIRNIPFENPTIIFSEVSELEKSKEKLLFRKKKKKKAEKNAPYSSKKMNSEIILNYGSHIPY